MKKISLILLLSVFAVIANAQVIYYAHAYKVPGTMEYIAIDDESDTNDKYIFELDGSVLIQKDPDTGTSQYYQYNEEASVVMEYPSYLRQAKNGDYVLMVIGKDSEIIAMSDFNPEDPEESVIDKSCTIYWPSEENNTQIAPPSNSYGGNSYSGNSYGGNSSNSNGALLESQYRQWENRARSNYNSLTNLGSQYKRNGRDVRGTTGQGMRPSNYTQMMRSLREAQQEMRSIRQKASRQGISIPKSSYEDVVVKY